MSEEPATLPGKEVKLLMAFDSQVLCPSKGTPHVLKNLNITVMFWELSELEDSVREKNREQFDLVFEQSKKFSRIVSRTGLPVGPGHVIIPKVLKLYPQVTSICWN